MICPKDALGERNDHWDLLQSSGMTAVIAARDAYRTWSMKGIKERE